MASADCPRLELAAIGGLDIGDGHPGAAGEPDLDRHIAGRDPVSWQDKKSAILGDRCETGRDHSPSVRPRRTILTQIAAPISS